MFTGIIESLAHIASIKPKNGGIDIVVASHLAAELSIDDSISVNGVCQTVVSKTDDTFLVHAVQETLDKTTFSHLKTGTQVNLERCLTPTSRLDGHIVQGHVDTVGTVVSFQEKGSEWLLEIEYPAEFIDLIVGRGSVSIEGISLTVAREEGHKFLVAIIPYTYKHTNLHTKKKGDKVNLEFDILGKYVQRFLTNRTKKDSGLTLKSLFDAGFVKS